MYHHPWIQRWSLLVVGVLWWWVRSRGLAYSPFIPIRYLSYIFPKVLEMSWWA